MVVAVFWNNICNFSFSEQNQILHNYCFAVCIQVGHLKNMEKIQAWSDHVILHVWHCANMFKSSEPTSDEKALEQMKVQGVSVKSILIWFLDYGC